MTMTPDHPELAAGVTPWGDHPELTDGITPWGKDSLVSWPAGTPERPQYTLVSLTITDGEDLPAFSALTVSRHPVAKGYRWGLTRWYWQNFFHRREWSRGMGAWIVEKHLSLSQQESDQLAMLIARKA